MFKNMTIKVKLILLTIISAIGLGVLTVLLNSSISNLGELKDAQTKVEELKSDMLMLRRNEKDFILRKAVKYKGKFEKNVKVLHNDSKQLISLLKSQGLDYGKVNKFDKTIDEYKDLFFSLIAKQQEIGLHPKDGLHGSLRSSVHKVQDSAKKSRNNKLLAKVYDLRKQEKDFMLRRDTKYVDKYKSKINNLLDRPSLVRGDRSVYLQSYKKDFLALVKAEIEIGLTSKVGIQGTMRGVVHTTETLLKTMSKELETTISSEIKSMQTKAFIIALLLIVLIIIISMIIMNNIVRNLKSLEDATEELKRTGSAKDRIDVHNEDEIGKISLNLNEYLDGIERGILEDADFIKDVQSVMTRVQNGWLDQHIVANTNNPALVELKSTINVALTNLKNNFIKLNGVLESYINLDYTKELALDNIEKDGVFDTLIIDINKLRDAITTMLVENKSNGLILQSSSDVLLGNVDSLNTASNEAAASLEEIAAALEQITSNISNNTETVVKMASYGNDVKGSVSSGQNLANQTTKSMDEINTEVSAISEAITVIDQISFQTNILSLNAAVEAATAGEAGKGFAVVAQEVRNLASRSAEAANEIKALVSNATNKANAGKSIADEMIDGYTHLNESITKTLDMISDVEMASKEQQHGIEQINDAVAELDQQTQKNANVASHTKDIAVQTQTIAHTIVSNADEKEFVGKDSVKGKEMGNTKSTHTPTKGHL